MQGKVILITQARISSTRLPAKVLKKIGQKTLLEIHLERILKSKLVDEVIVATTHEDDSEKIIEIANKMKVKFYQGSTDDVLDRYYQASKIISNVQFILRVTSDCPLISPELIDDVVLKLRSNPQLDYVSNNLKQSYPHGLDVEGFKPSALEKAWVDAKEKSEREHVTPYIRNHSTFYGKNKFKSENLENFENLYDCRVTVDYQEDFDLVTALVTELGDDREWMDYVKMIKKKSL